jgi:hypothetical protein
MRAVGWIAIALLVACERAVPDECPDGAKLVANPGLGNSRTCTLADGTRHGPWSWREPDGSSRSGSFERGKRQGVWQTYVRGRLRSESHYHLDERHGRFATFADDGSAVVDCYMHAGVLHGHCDLVREVGLHLAGRRVGTWKELDSERRVVEVKVYDTGVLLSVGGRRVPPPPPTLSTGTTTIDREECQRNSRSVLYSSCRELFDAHSRCALAPRPEECRGLAIQTYLAETFRGESAAGG